MVDFNDQNLSGIDIANGNGNKLNTDELKKEPFIQNENKENIDTKSNENHDLDREKLKHENEELKNKISNLETQIEELKENWARERAEFSNYRKRIQKEILSSKQLGIEELSKHLLVILDNLEMVISSKTSNPEIQNFITGVQMIRDEFLRVLERYNIKRVVEKGDKFNPNLMEAIDVEYNDNLNEEIVLEVYKKGFIKQDAETNNTVVLRVASVKVGKPRQSLKENNNESNEEKNKIEEDKNHK